ncbi:MAG: DUF4350 domain-containing protein [Polyangiaceae bacterium]|nr:DUF4350 domain-containing protein [Polyangiaceae bacterium]
MTFSVTHRTARLLVVFCVALVAALIPGRAHAGAFDVNDTSWEGCSDLLEIARGELGASRVVPLAVVDWEQIHPEDGVLALHPMQPMDAEETSAFMKAGGRLAIIDDYGRGNETLRRFHIERASPPARPAQTLRNRPALAIAEPVLDIVAGRSAGPHPVVANVQKLVTNHPTGLLHPNLSPVLQIRAVGEPDVVIAVAGQVGKGRLFAMSDPSAVMNQMIRYPGNRSFAAGLARYLVDDDGPMLRKGKLYIVANKFDERGAFGGQNTIRKDFDSALSSLAEALAEARNSGFPPWMHVILAFLVVVGAAVWAVRAAARTYKSPLPRYARRIPLIAQGGAAGRFAMLAAPTSARGLVLLELKSALYETVAQRFGLDGEPSPEILLRLLAGLGNAVVVEDVRRVLDQMTRVEGAVVANQRPRVSLKSLIEADAVIRSAIALCQADAADRSHRAKHALLA